MAMEMQDCNPESGKPWAGRQAVHALALKEKADCVLSDAKRLRALLRLDLIRVVGTQALCTHYEESFEAVLMRRAGRAAPVH